MSNTRLLHLWPDATVANNYRSIRNHMRKSMDACQHRHRYKGLQQGSTVHTRQPIKDVSKSTNWQHTCVFSLTNPTTQNSDYFLFKDPLYPLQSTLVLHTLSNFPIRSQEQALHFSWPGTVLYFKLWKWPLMIFCRGWWLQQDLIKELICYISIFIYPKSLGIPSQTLNIDKMKPKI